MQKKALVLSVFALCLWAVGCADTPDVSLDTSLQDVSSAVSEQSVTENISLPEPSLSPESSLQESTAEEISLPAPTSFDILGRLHFCPEDDWEQTGDCTYASFDGTHTLRAELLTLPDPKGITAELLVADALATLPDAIAQTGAELVVLERAEITLNNQVHPAVSLVTRKDTKDIYQQQVYLLDGGTVLLLTVTTYGNDARDALWTYFQ